MEVYTPQRQAEFLLSGAVDAKDYARAVKQVRKMGLDPARIQNIVAPARLGFTAGQSVVFLTTEAARLFEDLRPDAVVGSAEAAPASSSSTTRSTRSSSATTRPPSSTTTEPAEESTTSTTEDTDTSVTVLPRE